MDLREGEHINKVFHHHPFPFIMQMIRVVFASIPFFFLIFIISSALTREQLIMANLVVVVIFTLVIVYMALIYWLDKIVITNYRVVHIDWKLLTQRDEGEALLYDIQDIHTHEKGIFASLYLFDYGNIRIETASSKTTILFIQAPDPEGIKIFLTDHIEKARKTNGMKSNFSPEPIRGN